MRFCICKILYPIMVDLLYVYRVVSSLSLIFKFWLKLCSPSPIAKLYSQWRANCKILKEKKKPRQYIMSSLKFLNKNLSWCSHFIYYSLGMMCLPPKIEIFDLLTTNYQPGVQTREKCVSSTSCLLCLRARLCVHSTATATIPHTDWSLSHQDN